MHEIDDAIQEVEKLYRTITGQDVPKNEVPYAPIPAEKNPGSYVEEQLDRLFAILPMAPTAEPPVTPTLSGWETEREIIFCLEVPGARKEKVHVHRDGHVVRVTAERVRPKEARLLGAEHPIGGYMRTILLPLELGSSTLQATVEDGVLEIRVQKPGASRRQTGEVPIH